MERSDVTRCSGQGLPECFDCRRHVADTAPYQRLAQPDVLDGRCIDYLPPAERPRLNGHAVAL